MIPAIKREWLLLFGILLFSFGFRLLQLDTAFFGPEQAWIAQASWKLANWQEFPTHMFTSSVNHSLFPLTVYITFVPYLIFDHVYALLILCLLLNVGALGLCWWFSQRFWGAYVATLATLIYACMPWAILLSLRIWPNILLPPFVMLWAVGCGLAFGEDRPRWLMLAWGAAWLSFQLHVSGVMLLVTLFAMMWVFRGPQRWRYAFIGTVWAMVPALPWMYAQLTGAAELGLNLAIPAGRYGLQVNFERIYQFFTAHDLAANFISDGRDQLASRLAYMRYLAPIWSALYLGSLLFLVGRIWVADRQGRPLYLLLILWCLSSFGFTLFTEAPYTIVYYWPVLPAPCIALALLWQHLAKKIPQFGWVLLLPLLVLCALNLNAVWSIDRYIKDEIRREDPTSHAFSLGDHPPPLVWQLETAREIRQRLEAGTASELILVFSVDKGESPIILRQPFLHHLRGNVVRVLDIRQPHLLYPDHNSLVLWHDREPELEDPLKSQLQFLGQVGPYHLFQLAAHAGPAPRIPLDKRPAYENGLQLLGYDELSCEGVWQLHWTPGPALEEDGNPVHFFVHLLDAEGEKLAQRDLRAFDVRDWRDGDHIVTRIEFGQELQGLSIETIRVGLYYFSVKANTYLSGIQALDEMGSPAIYAVDIPFGGECLA